MEQAKCQGSMLAVYLYLGYLSLSRTLQVVILLTMREMACLLMVLY